MRNIIAIIAVFILVPAITGCGSTEHYGERLSNTNPVSIKELLSNPDTYTDKTVTVKGQIAIECDTGCWFNFKDKDAVIYVNLEPSGFAIPQKGGHRATVEGSVAIKDGKPILIGKGVEIR